MEPIQPRLRGALPEVEVEATRSKAARDIDTHPLYMQLREKLERAEARAKRAEDALMSNIESDPYTFAEYSSTRLLAQNEQRPTFERMGNSVMGLAGETGEIAEHVKKWFYHGKELDKDYLIKELGDVLWYVMYMADTIGSNLAEVAKANDTKLKKRYPNGFSVEAARTVGKDK